MDPSAVGITNGNQSTVEDEGKALPLGSQAQRINSLCIFLGASRHTQHELPSAALYCATPEGTCRDLESTIGRFVVLFAESLRMLSTILFSSLRDLYLLMGIIALIRPLAEESANGHLLRNCEPLLAS